MGFFDNIAKKILGNVVDSAVDRVTDKVEDKLGIKKETTSSASVSTSPKKLTDAQKVEVVKGKLEAIFASDYPSYEVRRDVSASTIGGLQSCKPYTFGLYLNGAPKAFVMVTQHNHDARRDFRFSREVAANNGIPFINFLTQFENKEEYIKNRLAENIK